MITLTTERRGEIAIKLIILQAVHDGLPSKNDFKRKVGDLHRETEIPKEELIAFFDSLVPETLRLTYEYQDVNLKTTRNS